MIKIVAHPTTMEIPIFNTLYDDEFKKIKAINNDIEKLNDLNFTKIDKNKFPLVNILKTLPNKNSLYETVIVSANDALVDLYLVKKIKYTDIISKIFSIIKNKKYLKMKKKYPKKISDIINLSAEVRDKIYKIYY